MFQKLKNALKGGPNSNSTKSGSTPDVPLAAFDKKWGIARVALHSVPSQIQSVAYDCVQVRYGLISSACCFLLQKL